MLLSTFRSACQLSSVGSRELDDVLVFGKDQTKYDARLSEVLKRIESAGATLNPEKCEFVKETLKFLGHVINEK